MTFASTMSRPARAQTFHQILALAAAVGMTGCAAPSQQAMQRETVYGVTASNRLISFNAGQPAKLLSQKTITGLAQQETLAGIDYRVAKGQLYALATTGRLYRLDTATGAATAVGTGLLPIPPAGTEIGFDFNPTVDRIRIVGSGGQNMRAHPDTGAAVDSDPNTAGVQTDGVLAYAKGDSHAGKMPAIAAAAYTYNKDNDKITTNYAIDAALGALVTQGTLEGTTPAVSPNTGQLFTVGLLGTGTLSRVSFDIADVSGAAFIAAGKPGQVLSSWYRVDLKTGRANLLGTIGANEPVIGIAIEP